MDHMEEELGDVLLQVVMHAQIAKESGHFDFEAVCRVVNEKLVTRHPHVFGDTANLGDSKAVLKQWDAIKAAEKKRGPQQLGRFKDLPRQLPALMFAQDVYKQIQKQQMDASEVLDEGGIEMTAAALATDEVALGKQLFEIAAACRIKQIDPESALRRYTQNVMDQLEKTH
jgi:XTP/dITP diphosphohydrolase/tetrapyrrole methylase family protein/MazG family protein